MSDHFFPINPRVITTSIKKIYYARLYNIFVFIKSYIEHFHDNQYYTDLFFFIIIIKINSEHNGIWGKYKCIGTAVRFDHKILNYFLVEIINILQRVFKLTFMYTLYTSYI